MLVAIEGDAGVAGARHKLSSDRVCDIQNSKGQTSQSEARRPLIMLDRQRILKSFVTTAILVLGIPVLTAAQGRDYPYSQRRDYPGGQDYSRYDRGQLRDAVSRVSDRSRSFENSIDRYLDRSRMDGTRREDRINDEVRNFRDAASSLRNRLGNARGLNNSADEARRLLDLGSRIDTFMSRRNLDNRAEITWSQIRDDLRTIANAYGFRAGEFLGQSRRW
jgi:hypothetical protein